MLLSFVHKKPVFPEVIAAILEYRLLNRRIYIIS